MGDAGLEVEVDREACRGARACVRRAPGTFSVDAARKAVATRPPGDPEEAVLDAARACPNFAIAVRRGSARIV